MLYYHKINGKKTTFKKNEKLKANLAEIIETLIYDFFIKHIFLIVIIFLKPWSTHRRGTYHYF